MTASSRRSRLSPPVVRVFEFNRFHNQLIALAYEVVIPVISRAPARSHPRSGRNQPTTIQDFQSKAGGA